MKKNPAYVEVHPSQVWGWRRHPTIERAWLTDQPGTLFVFPPEARQRVLVPLSTTGTIKL